jgi:hypothetical protein
VAANPAGRLPDRCKRLRHGDPAFVHDRHPVGERLGLVEIVHGEHDRAAGFLQLLDGVPGAATGFRARDSGWL